MCTLPFGGLLVDHQVFHIVAKLGECLLVEIVDFNLYALIL